MLWALAGAGLFTYAVVWAARRVRVYRAPFYDQEDEMEERVLAPAVPPKKLMRRAPYPCPGCGIGLLLHQYQNLAGSWAICLHPQCSERTCAACGLSVNTKTGRAKSSRHFDFEERMK